MHETCLYFRSKITELACVLIKQESRSNNGFGRCTESFMFESYQRRLFFLIEFPEVDFFKDLALLPQPCLD